MDSVHGDGYHADWVGSPAKCSQRDDVLRALEQVWSQSMSSTLQAKATQPESLQLGASSQIIEAI